MGKGAGIWKKIKQVGKTIGKGLGKAAAWVNENIYKPGKDLFRPVFDVIDDSGTLNKIADGVSKVIDYGSEKLGYTPDDSFGQFTEQVGDVILDTQRSDQDKKYKDPFETAIQLNEKFKDAVDDYNTYRRIKNGGSTRNIDVSVSYGGASDQGSYSNSSDDESFSDSEYYLDEGQQQLANMIKNKRKFRN